MAVDRKITELPVSSAINSDDVSVLVHSGVDYQYSFSLLLDFLQSNLTVGAVVLFQNATPSSGTGKNGDVVIKPASGEFWQKIGGVWSLQYTIPISTGNAVLYGSAAPNNATGNDGDTYIKTDGGVFYQKVSGSWTIKFSMATGPAGAAGAPGAAGAAGADGKTILNGNTPPSNLLGNDGDFYINTSINYLYGPKVGGVWPSGIALSNSNGVAFKGAYTYINTDTRFSYDSVTLDLVFTLSATEQALFPYDPDNGSVLTAFLRQKLGANQYRQKNEFNPIVTDDGVKYISVQFEGVDSDLINNCQIILM